jgi:DNA-binding response OmpR family regulator
MPAISGIEALKEIKKIHPKTDVIMLTACASEDNKQKAKELGAYGFITKPFDVSELRSYINRVLERSGNSEQRA